MGKVGEKGNLQEEGHIEQRVGLAYLLQAPQQANTAGTKLAGMKETRSHALKTS